MIGQTSHNAFRFNEDRRTKSKRKLSVAEGAKPVSDDVWAGSKKCCVCDKSYKTSVRYIYGKKGTTCVHDSLTKKDPLALTSEEKKRILPKLKKDEIAVKGREDGMIRIVQKS